MATMSDDVRTAAEAADRQFMERFNSGDVEGAARGVYTQDAVLLPPGAPRTEGREAIVGFWRGAAEQLGVEKVDLSTVSFTSIGDHAYQIGRAILTLKDGVEAEAKYLVIWKQEDGAWKWHVDIWNSNA